MDSHNCVTVATLDPSTISASMSDFIRANLVNIGVGCLCEWGLIHVIAALMMCPQGIKNDIVGYYVPGLVELAPESDQAKTMTPQVKSSTVTRLFIDYCTFHILKTRTAFLLCCC